MMTSGMHRRPFDLRGSTSIKCSTAPDSDTIWLDGWCQGLVRLWNTGDTDPTQAATSRLLSFNKKALHADWNASWQDQQHNKLHALKDTTSWATSYQRKSFCADYVDNRRASMGQQLRLSPSQLCWERRSGR